MKTTTISCKTGIYDTEYTIRDYGKKIVVTAPIIKWVDNSGSLDFFKTTVTHPKTMQVIRGMAKRGEYVNNDPTCETLDGILADDYRHLPTKKACDRCGKELGLDEGYIFYNHQGPGGSFYICGQECRK